MAEFYFKILMGGVDLGKIRLWISVAAKDPAKTSISTISTAAPFLHTIESPPTTTIT
jgi:hypothetical protein